MKCCIPFCSSERKKGEKQSSSYHGLPFKEPQRSKWVKIIMKEYDKFGFFCTLGPYTCICGLHFLKDDFRKWSNSFLKPTAVPSVFKYPSLKIRNVRIKNKLNQDESISVISTLPNEPPPKTIKLENQNDIYYEQSLTEIGNQDENGHIIPEVKYDVSSNEEISKDERNLLISETTFNPTFSEHLKKLKTEDEEKLSKDEENSLLIPEITLNSTSNGQNMIKVKIEKEDNLLIPEIAVDSVAKGQNEMKIESLQNEINLSSSSSNIQCLQFIFTGSQYN